MISQSSFPRRRRGLQVLAGALMLAPAGASHAADAWPAKTVTLVVPFAPGGATDVVARLLAQKLSLAWGQAVVVDNRAGAGGNIGANVVAKAAPDGYMLLMASGSVMTVNPTLYTRLPFNVQKDFAPITNVARGPLVVTVPAASDIKSLADLVSRAKAKPHELTFGSAGIGSQVQMAAESLTFSAGIDMQHIPYKGESQALTDLMAGQVNLVVANIAAVTGQLNGGRLRALAVTSKDRSKSLPNVPAVAETGVPGTAGMDISAWFGLIAPAGTPAEVVDKVWHDTAKAMAEPGVVDQLAAQGMVAVANSPADFRKAIDAETRSWATIIKTRKITIDGQ